MVVSDAVAVLTCSHVMDVVVCRLYMSESCILFSMSEEVFWSLGEIPVISCDGTWQAGVVTLSVMLWTSSVRSILSGLRVPVGWRDTESGALFFTPGMCTMEKRYRRVFSFRLRSLVLWTSSSERSPKIFSSGLWSTAMTRLVHPKTRCLALSRASATASASPSIRAYLDSAAWVNRLPTRVIFRPSLQQKRSLEGHLQ